MPKAKQEKSHLHQFKNIELKKNRLASKKEVVMTQESYKQQPLSLGLNEATAAYEKVNKSFETGGGGAAVLNTSLTNHE